MTPDGRADIYRLIAEQMGDALIFADRDGIIRAWNGAADPRQRRYPRGPTELLWAFMKAAAARLPTSSLAAAIS